METYKEYSITSAELKKKTIFSIIILLAFLLGAVFIWRWIESQPQDNGAPKSLRTILNSDELFFSNFLSPDHLAKTFPIGAAVHHPRVNGDAGMGDDFDPASWKLHVVRKPGDTLMVSLAEIQAMPKTEIIFDFKCIEGWSQVTHWGGVKFSDFIEKYGLTEQSRMKYAGLITPDSAYYVGIDMASIMHPQTLLCYEMNGAPLPLNQGYPLRLIIPVKYGIKNIKRIGTLSFSNDRPADYWYERGYDYYSGL